MDTEGSRGKVTSGRGDEWSDWWRNGGEMYVMVWTFVLFICEFEYYGDLFGEYVSVCLQGI